MEYHFIVKDLKLIWANPGYKIIAEELLKMLDFQSVSNLRLTSKLLKHSIDESRTWWILIIHKLCHKMWQVYRCEATFKTNYFVHDLQEDPHVSLEGLARWNKTINFLEKFASRSILKEFALAIYAVYTHQKSSYSHWDPAWYLCSLQFHSII